MSLKTGRTLLIIAFALFALALLFSVASIVAQKPIKSLYTTSPEIIAFRSVPFATIAANVIHVVLALIYVLVVFGRSSHGAVKNVGITVAVLFVAFDLAIIPLINMFVGRLVTARETANIASYTILSSFISNVTHILYVPAYTLMFISIGGLFGKDPSKESAQPA